MMKLKLIIFFCLIFYFGFSINFVFAQVIESRSYRGLVLSPLIREYKAKPGDVIQGSFEVRHDYEVTNRQVVLFPYSQDFTSNNNNGSPVWVNYKNDDIKSETSMEDWITMQKESISLKQQGDKKEIFFTITVPLNSPGGTHQTGIVFSEQSKDSIGSGNVVTIGERVAGLVFVEVDGVKTKELNVDEIKVSDIDGITPLLYLFEYLPVNIDLKIRNSGNVNIAPSGDVFITPSGKTASTPTLTFNEEGSRILAKSTRNLRTTWLDGFFTISKNTLPDDASLFDKLFNQYTLNLNFGKPFRIGAYDINVKVNYTDANNEFKSKDAKVTIFVLPWKMILLVILLIVIYIIIRKIRSRRKKHVYKEYREIPYEKKYSKFIDE